MSGTLAHSPAYILMQALVDQGVGVVGSVPKTGTWPIFVNAEPTEPDDLISCIDQAGRLGPRNHVDGSAEDKEGVQILVRSVGGSNSGWIKANAVAVVIDEDIYDQLVTISGTQYNLHSISRRGTVISLGKDENQSKRNYHSINVLLSVRPQSDL